MKIDYLTITGKSPIYTDPACAYSHARTLIRKIARAGGTDVRGITFTDVARGRFYDFSMRAGGGAIAYDTSASARQGWRLTLSSAACQRLCVKPDEISQVLNENLFNVTRIDYALDIMRDVNLDMLCLRALQTAQASRSESGRMPSVRVDNRVTGHMLTFGSRVSDYYVRMYNKKLEQNMSEEIDWFRFEVEVKKAPALAAARGGVHGMRRALARGARMMMRAVGDVAPVEIVDMSVNAVPAKYTTRETRTASESWYYKTVIPAFRNFAEQDREAAMRVLLRLIDALPDTGDT